MSCVCILTPIVIAAWPAFSAAVMAAATSLGYTLVEENQRANEIAKGAEPVSRVDLEVPNSELVIDTLHRDQRISVMRDGVTVTFSINATCWRKSRCYPMRRLGHQRRFYLKSPAGDRRRRGLFPHIPESTHEFKVGASFISLQLT